MIDGKSFLYEFGPYHLNASERVLMRGGSRIRLTPKAYATLLVLVENSGHVVNKDELMKVIWPDAFVEDSNLTQNIFTLRRILGKTRDNPRYIETVPRRGYRFAASVKKVSEVAAPELARRAKAGKISKDKTAGTTTRVLAVLPFLNVSGDVNMEYLSDGITESIINSLSQLPGLRVMSRSAVFRQKAQARDAQRIGKSLGVDAVLVGRVHSLEDRLLVNTELVDVANGWQLWGENYDRGQGAILEVQDEIARQISAALKLKLTGAEEQLLTKRYTESSEAYQAYLQGRYHWSRYNRVGIEEAIGHFRQAIKLDPNYALAYAGIIDCYLRLATNYILPDDESPATVASLPVREAGEASAAEQPEGMSKIRFAWDMKTAEREFKRAAELKSNYPAAHQWYAAYLFSLNLYRESLSGMKTRAGGAVLDQGSETTFESQLLNHLQLAEPTPSEQVQVFCAIAREQIDAGNYEAACAVLERWWTLGAWPRLDELSSPSSADLLLTCGTITGWVASARQVPMGQKHAEELLNGSIAIFEQLGLKTRAAEGRIELATCYWREGMSDLARSTLLVALEGLPEEACEIRSVGLVRLALIERTAGRLENAHARLTEAAGLMELTGPWVSARYHQELATTLKNIAISEPQGAPFDQVIEHYQQALYEFEAIGNHRYVAAVENNYGNLLSILHRVEEAEEHLMNARKLFEAFVDRVRRAQVDETLAKLHLDANRLDLAEQAVGFAVETLETGGEESLLAEALTTQGVVLCRMGRHQEAKRVLENAYRVAERCGDAESAGRALFVVVEELRDQLEDHERSALGSRLERLLLGQSPQSSTRDRLKKSRDLLLKSMP
jgi:TolB-like protein